MGTTKQTTTGQNSSTTTPTGSPLEQQFNQTMANNLNSLIPQAGQTSSSFLNLLNQWATAFGGGAAAQGPLGQLMGGISPDVQNSIVQESLRQLGPQFGQGGILNSGAAASIASRTAGDIYRNSAQFNVNNLGNVLSSLLTGNAQTQQPINQQAGILSSNLQGLRTTNQQGTSSSTQSQNPFLQNFYGGLGTGLGGAITGGLNPTNFASSFGNSVGGSQTAALSNPFGKAGGFWANQ